ncbi:hypothetical protein DY000_02055572 [Brassica cretica]|uniref:Uncharacterized protein n=1 Tax=Brassica cretica TaxID=69181 RepID=A0ABQ7A9Y6_BRACR|nr:hypothetical protein DY000_02055572 [Brassica cretica]
MVTEVEAEAVVEEVEDWLTVVEVKLVVGAGSHGVIKRQLEGHYGWELKNMMGGQKMVYGFYENMVFKEIKRDILTNTKSATISQPP